MEGLFLFFYLARKTLILEFFDIEKILFSLGLSITVARKTYISPWCVFLMLSISHQSPSTTRVSLIVISWTFENVNIELPFLVLFFVNSMSLTIRYWARYVNFILYIYKWGLYL